MVLLNNNTIITITDRQGNPIAWGSAGSDYRGARKRTQFLKGVALDVFTYCGYQVQYIIGILPGCVQATKVKPAEPKILKK